MGFYGGILWRVVSKQKRIRKTKKGKPGKTAKSTPPKFPDKFIREGRSVYAKKQAISAPIQSRMNFQMMWTCEKADREECWSWGQARDWGAEAWKSKISPFLRDYENKRWKDIEAEQSSGKKRHFAYEVEDICSEAQRRLEEIQLDDLTAIFRFRVQKKPRLYGFRIQHIFYVLWWDPHHKIYESDVQNRGKNR